MSLKKTAAILGAAFVLVATSVPVDGQEKRGRNRNAEEAAKWLKENGDKIVLYVGDPPTRGVLFSTDKKFVEIRPKESSFRMTKDEAVGIVQVLVETGWGHSHPPFLGLQPPARYLGLHAQGADGGGFWKLGDVDDDVSSLLIIKHLLKTLDGDRKAALTKWLK
jgi:hypothetical protein